jgi:hypothetical protein
MIDPRTKGRLQLIIVGTFFIGPFLLAWFLYSSDSDWFSSSGTQHGLLLDPPRLLPDAVLSPGDAADGPKFRDKWSLIIVGDAECGATCQDALYETRQVRRAMGRDDGRIQRVFFVETGESEIAALLREHPALVIIEPGSPVSQNLATVLGNPASGDVFLADPLGNLILQFPRETGMKAIHKDLKHLLKVSHIG